MLKWLFTLCLAVILVGLLAPRLSARLGQRRLPGDLAFRFRGRIWQFPFASTLLFSLLLSGIVVLLNRLL